jgi:thioredoxin-disulfide reductase
MINIYDTIIIGAGPAGMTAGIYATRREMKTLIIGREIGGQVSLAGEIENYPGFKSISGFDLINSMQEQTKAAGAEIKNYQVENIEKNEDGNFLVRTVKETFEAKTIIIAMGLSPRRLAIPGEKEFLGKGVSYCANCDGPFYKNKTVAVVGGGNAALDAAEVLSKIAKQVYLIHYSDKFAAFDVLVDKVKTTKNIEMFLNSAVKEIKGEQKVNKIKILNSATKEEKELEIDGIFIEVGRVASTDLVADFVERNESSQIIVNDKCQTKTEGVFAAGDVTNVAFKQITIACGQGTIAALAAYQYLQLKAGKTAVVLDRSKKK